MLFKKRKFEVEGKYSDYIVNHESLDIAISKAVYLSIETVQKVFIKVNTFLRHQPYDDYMFDQGVLLEDKVIILYCIVNSDVVVEATKESRIAFLYHEIFAAIIFYKYENFIMKFDDALMKGVIDKVMKSNITSLLMNLNEESIELFIDKIKQWCSWFQRNTLNFIQIDINHFLSIQ